MPARRKKPLSKREQLARIRSEEERISRLLDLGLPIVVVPALRSLR